MKRISNAGLVGVLALFLAGLLLAAASGADTVLGPPDLPAPDLAQSARVEQFKALAGKAAPAVGKVFQALAVPQDEIELDGKKIICVEPTAEFLGSPGSFSGKVKVKEIAKDGAVRELTKADVLAWKPYEETALAHVLDLRQDKAVAASERLAAAQTILVAVWQFHLARRDRPASGANPWQALDDQLGNQLLDVRLEFLRELTTVAGQEDLKTKVLPFAGKLVKIYPTIAAIKTEAAQAWTKYAGLLLAKGETGLAEAALAHAEQWRPDLPKVKALRQQLQDKLPLPEGKPVLRVGVDALPEFLSPALAWTDAELAAVDLLFESLLQAREHHKLGQTYEPVLAASLPQVLVAGRRFTLRHDAFWSTGERVTPGDVRAATELLRQPGSGTSFFWKDLLQPPKFTGNPWQIDFHYNLAFFDPLLPFTFKVLPQSYHGKPLASASDPDFARNPVGSGPFVYVPPAKPGTKGPVHFVVNKYHPYARQKSGFAEIQFHVSRDPVAELSDPQQPFHLILNVSDEKIAYLKKNGAGKIKTVGNRRVHFLAVNHRQKSLQDRDLRKGLAAAVHRQSILDQCFRGKDPAYAVLEAAGAGLAVAGDFLQEKLPEFHKPLNGPFPAGSWACKPDLPADPFDPEKARYWLGKSKGTTLTLTLVHPNNGPRVTQACKLMAEQIEAAALQAKFDLHIELKPLAPRKLVEAVYGHEYDLAYFHWDFGSEYCWLWPLFADSEKALDKGGSNFLGYEDAELVSLLNQRITHQDFAPLKKISHNIHAHLDDKMPLIPLWQLDTHLALHPSLDLGELDAEPVFAAVTQWKLK